MADFTTTKIRENAPSLNYITPKSMPAKSSSLKFAADSLKTGIETAIEIDKMDVVKTAEERAEAQVEGYEQTSPSQINFYKEQKQTAIENLVKDPDNPMFLDMLEKSNSSLALAREQNRISAYEFKQRSRAIADELLADNPAYSDEILASMERVYKRTGVKDTIALDTEMMESRQEAYQEETQRMVDFLEIQKIPMEGMDSDAIRTAYRVESERLEKIQAIKNNTDIINAANDEDKAKMRAEVYRDGGPYAEVNGSLVDYQNNINEILDGPKSNDEKRKLLEALVIKERNALGAFVDLMGSEKYNYLYTDNIKAINDMHTDAEERISGKKTKDDMEIQLNTDKFRNQLNIRLTQNPELQKYQLDQIRIFEIIKNIAPGFNFDRTELIEMLSAFSNDMVKTDANGETGVRVDANDLSFKGLFNQTFLEQVPAAARTALQSIEEQGAVTSLTKGHLNNLWNVTSSLGEDRKRIPMTDKLVQHVNAMPQKVNIFMMKNSQDYSSAYMEEQNRYKDIITRDLKGAFDKTDGKLPNISRNESLGILTTTDPAYRSAVGRFNRYIEYKARGMDKKPSEIFEETMNEFPRLSRKEPKEFTYEEAESNPGNVGPFDIVVMPSGQKIYGPEYVR